MKTSFLLALSAAVTIMSCSKSDTPAFDPTVKAELSVEFDNIAGAADLQLATGTYTNATGESFKVNKLVYYVSNFKVANVDGSVYTIPQDSCYFLIDESKPASHQPVLSVPEGEYKSISFMIGVDSLRNTADISQRTGVLDPAGAAADMYWGWNSGYIFFKMEGTSTAITTGGSVFMYHIGGFGGYSSATANNTRTVTLDLTARGTPKVKAGKETNIHLMVDVLKALNGSTNMSFATTPMIHSIAPGVPVANNYTAMFRHDHTEN